MEIIDRHKFNTEEEFRTLMDPLPILVRACKTNGDIIYCNAAWKQFAGNINSWSAGIHIDSRSANAITFATQSNLESTFKSKYKFADHSGVYHWLAEKSVPWYSNEDVFLGFICYALVTGETNEAFSDQVNEVALEREQALNEELQAFNEELNVTNEELQRSQNEISQTNNNLEQILNMLPASVVVIRGYDLVVEMINNSNLKYWNKTKEEVLGKRFLEILPDLANQPFAGQLRHVMETGEIIDIKESPVLFTTAEGEIRETYVDYTYQPLSDLNGKRTGVLVMSFEITDRILARRQLEKYATELASSNAQLQLANQELARSEARFKYLIQEAPVAIGVLHTRDMIIESANAKILEVWGKSSEIVGMPLSAGLPELQGQPFLDILDDVYSTGKLFYANEISSMLEHNGELKEIFFNVTYQPIADASGATVDILVVAVDVTKQVNSRKMVEQSEQHFRQLADLVPAKISNARPTGEVIFLNKQWLDFAGMGFENLRDFGYHQMMHPEEVEAFQAGLADASRSGVPYASEMRFKNAKGEYVWHLNIAAPIFDEEGNVAMWVGSTTNIQSMKEEVQRKSDFVSMLSHELKTPVTSIKGHVQLLLRALRKEPASTLTNRLQPSLSRIDQLLVQLTGLISDMLDMTRIDSGRLDLKKEPLVLDALVTEVVEDFRLSHQQHVFQLDLESGIVIQADKHKISQVLINLIANAVKYAPKSHLVNISSEITSNEVLIRVKDFGIGIEEKDQQKIFERFYRVEGQSEFHYSGFGIGLYLGKSIVDAHGGRISLESHLDEGSTFTIHLPV